ncbi:hypothetical protein [Brevundimonas sp. Root1279]|uniref:hypothetical protein n=1 Tax=Brevundimonas sp. Root1279 TaxID=1736443 RepID=UPI0006F5CE21|nr:hypothetical protein [Brevundimonas sp. Root1279]KQW81765.1 hypothetical protein ASC65_10735 [Brevundimonas sp. Root1279]
MSRLTLIAAVSFLALAPTAFAQIATPQSAAPQTAHGHATASTPAVAEMTQAAPQGTDEEQDPAELAATASLNQRIASRNDAAAETEAASQAAFEISNTRWREETARLATEQAQWEANKAAADAAKAQYERDKAAWEAQVAACQRSGRVCVTGAPQG